MENLDIFADDIILMTKTPQELEEILNAIHTVRQQVSLNMYL